MLSGKKRAKRICRPYDGQSCRGKLACKRPRFSEAAILDLRQSKDYEAGHIRGSQSSPLKNLTEKTGDIFQDPNALPMHRTNLRVKFSEEVDRLGSKTSPLFVLCYDGETSRLATSILRAAGYTRLSVSGGFSALRR
jgi:rhodanese-related sulfurtransferase